MREILFKAKRKDNGKWVEGYVYRISEVLNPFIMLKDKCGESYEVDFETVCQYTGLTDKNGEKIFENDRVKYIWEYWLGENIIENVIDIKVIFKDGEFRLKPLKDYPFEAWEIRLCHETWKIEVIGNIHDEED